MINNGDTYTTSGYELPEAVSDVRAMIREFGELIETNRNTMCEIISEFNETLKKTRMQFDETAAVLNMLTELDLRNICGTADADDDDEAARGRHRRGDSSGSPAEYTLVEYGATYLERKRASVKLTTYNNYVWMFKMFVRDTDVGGMLISDIRRRHLQELANERLKMYTTGLTRRGMIFIRGILNDAVRNELIKQRDFTVALPAYEVAHSVYNDDEFDDAVKACLADRDNPVDPVCILLAMTCGLRIGEICGLKWGDIDFKRKTVNVERNGEYVKDPETGRYHMSEQSPKTKGSRRKVPVPAAVLGYLKHMRGKDTCYVVSRTRSRRGAVNNMINPRDLRRSVYRWMDEHGLRRIKVHELRHTYASRLITGGADIKTASLLLGHSKVDMTLNVYTHSDEKKKARAIAALGFK